MAENDDPNTIIDDNGGEWRETLAGDNADNLAALKDFETPDKFFEAFTGMQNRNWRDDFIPEDDPEGKIKGQMERFKTPGDYGNAFNEAQQKIRSGQMQMEAPAADADDATVAAYREQNGIPAESTGYLEGLPDGMVVGEDDKELFEEFMGELHKVNAPPAAAHAAVEWYNKWSETAQDDRAQVDFDDQKAAEDQLRTDWGGDYRANVNLIGGLIDKTFGSDFKDILLNARGPDGRAIMNTPGIMEGFAQLARTNTPISQIVSPTGNPEQTMNDEISELEKYMAEKRTEYNNDPKAQARLLELYEIRLQHNAA